MTYDYAVVKAKREAAYGKAESRAVNQQAKDLVGLLPKVKLVSEKDGYLASLDETQRKKVMISEYFAGLTKRRLRRSSAKQQSEVAFIVCQKPFPQLFEYKEGDEEVFSDCLAIKFTRFKAAHKLYKHLLTEELKQARIKRTAGHYTSIATKD